MFPSFCGAKPLTLTIEAIYQNGVLKPAPPLPLKEHDLLSNSPRAVAFPSLTRRINASVLGCTEVMETSP
jgi:hypothetical protein